ncbi:AAA family ATPase [Paraburkholderia youngii]|uniref:AAA family ATPase n=1 Tax=Paraburkholderia youngii TaxID=2782701 RepID=UPI003D25E288
MNTLLTELVNLRRHKVVLIAATNHLDKLDEAGVREGRFDFKVEVPPPDLKAREGLLRLGIVKALGPQAVDAKVIESVAARWEGFSVVRLTSVCEELKDMRREGKFGAGVITFETAMQAMRRIQGRSGKLPPDAKSVAEIIMPSQSREKLNDLVYKMKNVYKLEEMGGKLAPGLAFWGPPGTGKTEGAMALAKDSEWAFFSVSGADLLANFSLWDKTVREARNCRPSIIFIDEADRVLGDRSYSNCAALTDKIMETMSGSKGRLHDVIVIAATNRLDRFDPAVVRGARFEEKIRFDVPDADQMREYVGQKLAKLAGDRFGSHDAVTERAVAVLSGQSIANANAVLQKVIDIAAVRVLRGSEPELRLSDVDEAAESVFADLSADD